MKLLALLLSAIAGVAPNTEEVWPSLDVRHVFGRLATEEDLKDGSAVFRIEAGGEQQTTPTNAFPLPQFAYLLEANGNRRPVVVVQVEIFDGEAVFGMRDADGKEYIATPKEVELLGSAHP